MASIQDVFSERLQLLCRRYPPSSRKRILVALAGSPGSGKTTITASLVQSFNARSEIKIQVVPMDGFHYSKAKLSTIESTECPFQRRGAPFTFDAESFLLLIRKLRDESITEHDEPERAIWAPSFDHAKKDPVEQDIRIPSSQQIIIIEGNYLLLDENPWNQIQDLVDETWFVSVERQTAKERLIARHIAAGIETNRPAAEARVESNDLRNGDLIRERLIIPNVIVESFDRVLMV
ncbi:nicotinamide riboside kinase [Phlyctema vagabunda]|uniref:Nicotinamide riboside kinase n=1 Tax=Phlyctema vagabunda TaxID=108571 RepID=A0ABR4P4S0_9HELO